MKNDLVNFLLDYNKKQSETFVGSDASFDRRSYRRDHPTEIAALKCMDGRLHLAVTTKTPLGIIQPYRTLGGKFLIGDQFGQTFNEWVNYAFDKGRKCLVLVTYHFSKGDTHRGCAGHGYDTKAGIAYARDLKGGVADSIESVYGRSHHQVYPILVGIETDEDALVLHGTHDETFSTADAVGMEEDELYHKVESLYPDMAPRILTDLMPLLRGNVRHIKEVRDTKRPIADAEHKEQIIAVGRGFDWLHLHNKALIIGPYSFDMATPIGTAAKVVLSNIEAKRIPKEDGIVLLTSAIWRREDGPDRFRAEAKARTLARISLATIKKDYPQLMPHLKVLAGTVNMNNRLFTPIELVE